VDVDLSIALVGLFVGVVVGMTGMGGGALMTPILVLFFGVAPLSAVSSDLVVSLFMKPVGGAVHLRRGTVNLGLVKWLCIGSVPAAFAGVLLLRAAGDASEGIDEIIKVALGVALLLAVATMLAKEYLGRRAALVADDAPLVLRPGPTVVVGAIGGLVVGMTSVGSGSLIIVGLLLLYPTLSAARMVGTDLVQAVPLVASAALGHVLFGDVSIGLTASLLLGAIPGAWLGARLSASAPQILVRRVLAVVLLASGLKLVGTPTTAVGIVLMAASVLAAVSIVAQTRRDRRRADDGTADDGTVDDGTDLTRLTA
jgi:uncharacterized membrane protein YfcA